MASILNEHPECVTAIDNTVYESWGLYYYRLRTGLVQEIRNNAITSRDAPEYLLRHLVRNGSLYGVAPSNKVLSYPVADAPGLPAGNRLSEDSRAGEPADARPGKEPPRGWPRFLTARRRKRTRVVRYCVPLDLFETRFSLCLKSPEITFVLSELAESFRSAKFVLVYRSLIEISESMYRKGLEWSLPSLHKRWSREFDESGRLAPPPGVPMEWHSLWRTATDFQRCVLYGASYLRGLVLAVPEISPTRVFVYDHADLREDPSTVLSRLGRFLGVDAHGFEASLDAIRKDVPIISPRFREEYKEIDSNIGVSSWLDRVAMLDTFREDRRIC
jgi:hypothetical protein